MVRHIWKFLCTLLAVAIINASLYFLAVIRDFSSLPGSRSHIETPLLHNFLDFMYPVCHAILWPQLFFHHRDWYSPYLIVFVEALLIYIGLTFLLGVIRKKNKKSLAKNPSETKTDEEQGKLEKTE